MTSWIEDLALRRNSQNSNVFLVETLDFTRISQFREVLWTRDESATHSASRVQGRSEFGKLIKKNYDQMVEHDLQRMSMHDIKSGQALPVNAMESPYQQLDGMLRREPCVVVIKYVILPGHAETLSNVIVPWSHDPNLYHHKSTVVIFCASLGLFNDNVRRLCYPISIPPSTPEERRTILEKLAAEIKDLAKTSVAVDERQINASSGLTLHDCETAAMESFYRLRKFDPVVFTDYKVKILKNYGIEWIQPTRGFESVGGYQYLKDYVERRVIKVITNPEQARRYGLDIPKGILLFGPPGTGKTYFSKAIAKESGMPMLRISPADFLRGIVGETEARVKQLTNLIETMTPCIVFIDEFDQLSLRRDAQFMGDSGVSRRMQNMLLDWLGDENRKSFVVAATNFIDLDPAFIRPGRIDEIILVLPPDSDAREQIIKVHLGMRKVPVEKLDLAALAKDTFGWTGAELERLVKEAAALAMESDAVKVTEAHFDDAIKSFDVNVQERTSGVEEMIRKLKSLEQVNQRFLSEALKGFIERESAADARLKGLLEAMPAGAQVV